MYFFKWEVTKSIQRIHFVELSQEESQEELKFAAPTLLSTLRQWCNSTRNTHKRELGTVLLKLTKITEFLVSTEVLPPYWPFPFLKLLSGIKYLWLLRFGSNEWLKNNVFTEKNRVNTFMAGLGAGVSEAILVVTPAETLKVYLKPKSR